MRFRFRKKAKDKETKEKKIHRDNEKSIATTAKKEERNRNSSNVETISGSAIVPFYKSTKPPACFDPYFAYTLNPFPYVYTAQYKQKH